MLLGQARNSLRLICNSKARKCILLGYAELTKGYRLFDVENKKITYSRDVRFYEGPEDIPVDSEPKPNSDTSILIDSYEETEHD